MYLCMMYIGKQYAPGELISDLEPDFADRLIKAGAIEKVASAEAEAPVKDEEAETLNEIDVMAGIVPEAEKAEKPKKSGRSKKK